MRLVAEARPTSNNGVKAGLFATIAPITTVPTAAPIEDVAIIPPKRRRYRARGRRYLDNGEVRTARRALTGAQLYLQNRVPSLRAAADASGSTPANVAAMIVVVQSEDTRLLYHVLRGNIPLPVAAARVKSITKAVVAYRSISGSPEKLAAFQATIGVTSDVVEVLLKMTESEQAETGRRLKPDWTWDRLIMPAINSSEIKHSNFKTT